MGHGGRVLWLRTSGPAALYAGGSAGLSAGLRLALALAGASSPLELSEDDDNEPLPK